MTLRAPQAAWKKLPTLPAVDYGTVHLYPQNWGESPAGKPGTDPVEWGTKWITDHLSDGRALGKPVVLEEFGVSVNACRTRQGHVGGSLT